MRIHSLKRGHTLVETIIYIFILVTVLLVVVYMIISMASSYHQVRVKKSVESSAVFAMERLTRDIGNAVSVDTAQSTLGSSPGVLFLNTLDASGNPATEKFYVVNNVLQLDANGVNVGPLTLPSSQVSSLIFSRLSTTTSQAVKINLTLKSTELQASTTANFYSTTILHGSY